MTAILVMACRTEPIKDFDKTSLTQVAKFYPDQFVFTFKLDKSWGSCFIGHGGDVIKTVNYTKRLLLSKGLFLEVYKVHRKEKVGIKCIEVTLRENWRLLSKRDACC